jgi:hypothetical protein
MASLNPTCVEEAEEMIAYMYGVARVIDRDLKEGEEPFVTFLDKEFPINQYGRRDYGSEITYKKINVIMEVIEEALYASGKRRKPNSGICHKDIQSDN